MSKLSSNSLTFICVFLVTLPAFGQREVAGADAAKLALDRLAVCGTALMIGAHPDDENTAVLAYLARGRKLSTGYLSLTRGEGGQNLIGPEQGESLGVIRTEELLDARRIDGAVQFFTRAIDFGFTKTADETLQKWGRDRTLGDIVWVIRRFRPDIIILRFSGTPRDGHGQHQASAILGREAFSAAADSSRFPDQLKFVEPWQAKRLVWNVFAFTREQEQEAERMGGRVSVDTGAYDPLLGYSYGEIAGMSRSMHRSQGMGSPERKGSRKEYFVTVEGEPATKDLFDDVDTTWARVPGGKPAAALIAEAGRAFAAEQPERAVPALLKARAVLQGLKDPYAAAKLHDIDEAIALCAGIWVDAVAERASVAPGDALPITATAIRRSGVLARIENVHWSGTATTTPGGLIEPAELADNIQWSKTVTWSTAPDQRCTQAYWLEQPRDGDVYRIPSQELIGDPENPPLLQATFVLTAGGQELELTRPVVYRYVDRVYGERARPVSVVPPVAVSLPENAIVFPNESPRRIEVGLRATVPNQSGTVRLAAPKGWHVTPDEASFSLKAAGDQVPLPFEMVPSSAAGKGELRAVAQTGGREISVALHVIDYPHIPPQTLFPPSATPVVRADVRTLAHRVGYVMGAGDEGPQALRQVGIETVLLTADDLARGDLSRFDAIVTGVRAWNTRPDLRSNCQRLWAYADAGGTVVVQYNVLEGGFGGGDLAFIDEVAAEAEAAIF